MMRELSKKSRADSIRESLHQALKDLHEMLRHVLEGFSSSLEEEDAEDLNLLLMWVTCAGAPLCLGQLDTILKLRSLEGDGVLLLEAKLRRQFAFFFILTREDGLCTADLEAEKAMPAFDGGTDEEGLDDVENDTEFSSNPLTTHVVFCHASIGDFFRDNSEGKARSGHADPQIGVNIVESKVCVLKTCLNLICDSELSNTIKDSPGMLRYAQYKWHGHLKEALEVRDKMDLTEEKEIGKLLLQMLRDEAVVFRWLPAYGWDLFTLEVLSPVRAWLENANVLDGFAVGDRQWIESTKMNPAESYIPVARVAATKWLQASTWVAKNFVLRIHTIVNLVRGGGDDDIPDPDKDVPISVVMDAAEWPQFEKTALWHSRLAECLRDYTYYDEATEHFQLALDIDPETWEARSGIALIHATQQKYDKAIELCKTNDSILEGLLAREPKPKEGDNNCCTIGDRAGLHASIAIFYMAKGDAENSLKHYKTAIEFNKLDYGVVLYCIEMLADEMRNPGEIVSLLKGMDDKNPGEEWTRLTAMIWLYFWWDESFFTKCRAAAEDVKELPWMIEAYETAAAAARKSRQPVLATALDVCISELYQAANFEKDKIARLWKRVINLARNPGALKDYRVRFCKRYVTENYGVYCLDKARELEHGTPEEKEWIEKLERLCKAKRKATDDSPRVVSTSYSAIYLGLWYRENGHYEDANACFQPFIKEALMMLSDDDPENDVDGIKDLAHALVAAGEDESALAFLRSWRPELREEDPISRDASGHDRDNNEEEDEKHVNAHAAIREAKDEGESTRQRDIKDDNTRNEEAEKDDRGNATAVPRAASDSVSHDDFPFSSLMRRFEERYPHDRYRRTWWCDGPCDRAFPIFAEANMCRMCLREICDDCLKLVKSGDERARKTCNPQHTWFHVDAPEQEVEEGQMLVGGEVIPFEEFKERLRVKWKV